MNREQRKYTLEKIEHIAQEKRDKLNKLVERAEKTRWSEDDQSQFILNGEATIKKYDELVAIIQWPKTDYDLRYRHPSYIDFYDYPAFTPAPPVENYNDRRAAINAEATRLKDICMLGDAVELIEQLKAFEEKEF
ncbi:hypothetical protein HF883_10310 [Cloacibacillus porcorum]|uniref:hypothetical protein n=1 Tax=Cloacibacillus porcorum TaxID=1197717 RepID=UPI001459F000|nr:hypothetical protein [Cloacibacillus porcorum]NMF18612.1 hypothetical protein [Cloacibacillus porcorum]